MNNTLNNAMLATQLLKKLDKEDSRSDLAAGSFVDDLDFFQKERMRLLKEFSNLSVEDDLRVLQKEMLA